MMAAVKNRGAFARRARLWSLSSLLCYVGCGSSMNIALHAQAPPSKEMVVGSTVTMAGVRQALLNRDHCSANSMSVGGKGGGDSITKGRRWREENTTIFYPFHYDGLHDRSWDLVIIEGWFWMINAFIHEVRAISHPRPVTVLFYCLDPQYPGLPHVAALDVEGFLTNSESTREYLLSSAPTAFVPLAVDTKAFPFYPDPPCRTPCHGTALQGGDDDDALARDRGGDGDGDGRIVYVGAAGLMEYKEMLAWMLREALPYGLDIYGSGWQQYPEFLECWRGVLPPGDLAAVYGTALAVIGVTTDAQRESGKINNRVFEALAVGAPLISDHFPVLESTFGDALLYVRHPGDVARHIEALLLSSRSVGSKEAEENARQRRRTMIEASHTWDQRVEDILSFVGSLPGNSDFPTAPWGEHDLRANERVEPEVARCSRQAGCLTLAVVIDGDLEGDIPFESTFVPAVDLLSSTYLVTWWVVPTQRTKAPDVRRNSDAQATDRDNGEESEREGRGKINRKGRYKQLPLDASVLNDFDAVWAAGRWGGPADRAIRGVIRQGGTTSSPRMTTPRLTAQLTGLVLWGPYCSPSTNTSSDRDKGGRKNGVSGEIDDCVGYASDEGLRWYDVIYCQTRWDHAFLMRQAFEGNVSDNIQQAWGYGNAHPLRSGDVHDDSGQDVSISSTRPFDMLVVGEDTQVSDMLELFKTPRLSRVALAIVVPPGAGTTTAARPGLASVLAAAGVVVGAEIGDLPQRLSLYVIEPDEGSSFTPLAAEVLLVRGATDADALAELASGAAKVVVKAKGELAAWATLVTNFGVYDARWRGQGDVQMVVSTEDNDTNGGHRSLALIEERPEHWSAAVYSRRLIAGMTRALCLGRGNSRISLVRPSNEGSTAGVVCAVDTVVTVEVLVEDFHVGRDGQWCITVQGRTVLCVLQNEFAVDLHISSSAARGEWERILASTRPRLETQGEHDWEEGGFRRHSTEEAMLARYQQGFVRVEVAAELRSNMYQDVLQRSKPFHLLIDPRVGASSSYEVGLECMHEKGAVVGSNQTATPVGYGSSLGGHSSVKTSIDIKDYFETRNIVGVDAVCAYDDDNKMWR